LCQFLGAIALARIAFHRLGDDGAELGRSLGRSAGERLRRLARHRMRTLTEFSGVLVDRAAELRAAKLAEGPDAEALAAAPGEALGISGDRLTRLLEILEAGADRVKNVRLVRARERGLGLIALAAQVEMEIAQMPESEQADFLSSLGVKESARARFVQAA